MINQNLQMNKFKDLLKGMNRRINRLERYAGSSSRIEYGVADGFALEMQTANPTLGNSFLDCSYVRTNRIVVLSMNLQLGTTYVNGTGIMQIKLPWPLDVLSPESLVGYYQATTGATYLNGVMYGFTWPDNEYVIPAHPTTGAWFAHNVPWVWAATHQLKMQIIGTVEKGS